MEVRVRSQDVGGFPASRSVPLDHLLITATTSGAAQTFATVRANTMMKVRQLSVVNTTGSAATLTLHAIPDGGSVGAAPTEISAMSIGANTAVDLTNLVGGLYKSGATLKAFSGTGSALVLHGWAEEVL